MKKAFLVGLNSSSFRQGEPAEIIGLIFYTPEGLKERLCYKVRFKDGVEDFTAVEDKNNRDYEIITETEAAQRKVSETVK